MENLKSTTVPKELQSDRAEIIKDSARQLLPLCITALDREGVNGIIKEVEREEAEGNFIVTPGNTTKLVRSDPTKPPASKLELTMERMQGHEEHLAQIRQRLTQK